MIGKILQEVYENCPAFSEGAYRLIETNEEVAECDRNIKGMIINFERSLENEEIKKHFLKFCEELETAYTTRDCVITRLLVTRGMSLYLQMQTEILSV